MHCACMFTTLGTILYLQVLLQSPPPRTYYIRQWGTHLQESGVLRIHVNGRRFCSSGIIHRRSLALIALLLARCSLILPLHVDARWFWDRQHCTRRYSATDEHYYLTVSMTMPSTISSHAWDKPIIKGWLSYQPPSWQSIGFVRGS